MACWHAAWLRSETDAPERWLGDTPALEFEHHSIQIHAKKLTQLKRDPADQAIACFEFLRQLPFCVATDPTMVTAPDVLRARRGDSHTKGLLFVSLMRALGIPARLRMVAMGSGFMHGLLDTAGFAVSHAISEVFLLGRWMRLDAYCIDPKLGLAVRARLLREGLRTGYGLHMNGQIGWDASGDALGHFSPVDPASLPAGDLGVYDDPSQLLAGGWIPHRSLAGRAAWLIRTALVNRRIKSLRASLKVRPANAYLNLQGRH